MKSTRPPASAAAQAVVIEAEPTAEQDARVPYTVGWVEDGATKDGLRLVARIERLALTKLPLSVTLEIPAGLDVEGPREVIVPSAEAPDVFEQAYTLRFTEAPVEDLVLVVKGEAEDFGYHARVPYTFGRTPSEPVRPARSGPRVKVGPRDFGQAVPVGQ